MAVTALITSDVWSQHELSDAIRRYTRPYEFDYFRWEAEALVVKAANLSFGAIHHLTNQQQKEIVKEFFRLLSRKQELDDQITSLYGEPEVIEEELIRKLERDQALLKVRLAHQSLLSEPVLQYQISQAIKSLGISLIETPFPPVLFNSTPLPKQLIISPRDTIRQEKSISLKTDISLKEIIELEDAVEANTDFSALVVPIGGVSTYPTMVIDTTYLPSLLDTAAHEWIHNHLIFRPLGMRYDKSPALRTMNETTANISGDEIMREVLKQYYPEYFRQDPFQPDNLMAANHLNRAENQEGFNFSEQMYFTRIRVDELLADGKVEEAEAFMEEQRQFFWINGFQIRKLNQAYFSFYGAYADSPYSAAGRDPVGEDVRLFRKKQPDLSTFVWRISWMLNYRQLRLQTRAF